ncbi:MAG TPA: hypothetical protein VGI19_09750 [Candidatus Cybelea sp.]|jgi:hypothetical protein
MNRLHFYLSAALLCAASIVMTGCAGQPSSGTPSVTAPNALRVHSAHHSWMSPAAKGQALVYVSSVLTSDVYVYSYASQQLVGTLTGFTTPYGLCTDKKGDVWVVNDGASQLVEYAHGGTSPLATLSDPGEYPEGCAVDPQTGNLAVTNFYAQSGGGSVAIYAGAQGTATLYTDPSISEYRFCGYDNKGNLFVDGVDGSSNFAFAELPKGSGTFTNITLPDKVEWPGAVQWDGKYVAVGDTDASLIYRVKGTSGTIKSVASLGGSNYVNQFWIAASVRSKRHKDTVLAASQDGGVVGYYKYPAGGAATTTISVSEPFGVALSK